MAKTTFGGLSRPAAKAALAGPVRRSNRPIRRLRRRALVTALARSTAPPFKSRAHRRKHARREAPPALARLRLVCRRRALQPRLTRRPPALMASARPRRQRRQRIRTDRRPLRRAARRRPKTRTLFASRTRRSRSAKNQRSPAPAPRSLAAVTPSNALWHASRQSATAS